MDAGSSKFPVWFIAFVLLSIHVYVAEGIESSNPCVDGTYDDSGRRCCLCSTGQYLKDHCTTDLQYGKCERCPPKTYSSQPNNLDSCEPCTSCSQPNANLEEKEPCTSAVDTKCRCKQDHYCSSGTETCILCNPCKECPEGTKVACSAHNNTVCNEVNNNGVIISSIVGSLIGTLLVALIAYCICKRYRTRTFNPDQLTNVASDVEMRQLLKVVDLQPHRSDIAKAIGWKDMRDVARRSGISEKDIESCQLDNPDDSQEQTVQLLNKWMEKQGKEASKNLIKILDQNDKRTTAERVMEILSSSQLPA
ncbi:tumor necrosis factor receptor superfamily member 23 [Anarrhichthys ocellatus]|uniref:tumor necrosis factor receptor superfamily member 23 n=1 Tax=Anarrhichthys ocellatus TaxID=433405 RepID=UPI0012EE73D9|nr:tumor necrosis factor receptor superfamily member 23-like [Anarrhichthys ocellatus]